MSTAQQEVHLVLISNEPGRAYSAFVLALGAIAMGAKCKIYCTMGGLDIIKKGGAEKIQIVGAPPLKKYLKDAIESGVKVTACAPSKEMLQQMGITRENTVEGVGFEDVIGFLNEALPATKNGGMVLFI
jgi:predicted peroxiredoxin